MKPVQWAVAGVILAAMLFGLTFAMNYLQRPQSPVHDVTSLDSNRDLELTFLTGKVQPLDRAAIESELKTTSYQDFWITNSNPSPLVVGLQKRGCRCSAVEVFVVPDSGLRSDLAAASGVGSGLAGPLTAVANQVLNREAIQQQKLTGTELLNRADSATVPAHAVGWIRLSWKGEKAGAQKLDATLWLNSRDSGRIASLEVHTFHYEPLRLRRSVEMGLLTDAQLTKGVTRYLAIWSSTRPHFEISAKLISRRDTTSDPFQLQPPVPLTEEEKQDLEKENNKGEATPESAAVSGRVLFGYKIPFTVNATAPDGKTPADIGPFRRVIQLTSADVGGEPHIVLVNGRVRSLVELGNDDDLPGLDFLRFPGSFGAKTKISVYSSVPNLKLEWDKSRTPPFLEVTLDGPKPASEVDPTRKVWTVNARVLPDKVRGPFPRAEDPMYEDSAIYLRAVEDGKDGKQPRSVRIPARGTADQR